MTNSFVLHCNATNNYITATHKKLTSSKLENALTFYCETQAQAHLASLSHFFERRHKRIAKWIDRAAYASDRTDYQNDMIDASRMIKLLSETNIAQIQIINTFTQSVNIMLSEIRKLAGIRLYESADSYTLWIIDPTTGEMDKYYTGSIPFILDRLDNDPENSEIANVIRSPEQTGARVTQKDGVISFKYDDSIFAFIRN